MLIILIVCIYFIFLGITLKALVTLKGYEKFSDVPEDSENVGIITIGSIFWPVTLLVLLGISITKYFSK